MYTRHQQIPVFETRQGWLDAMSFNQALLALNRLGEPLRLSIPGLKTLDLIVQRDAWIVVDRAFEDVPVSVWTAFENQHRQALHLPVACQIRLFHVNAGLILKPVREAMYLLLIERLSESAASHDLLDFPDRKSR